MTAVVHWMGSAGTAAPWLFLLLFIAASLLMVWRLEAMTQRGVEGTVLGTLVMPYCSGMGNLIFAVLLGSRGGRGADVITNSFVNNVTNMTLLIGLCSIFWRLDVLGKGNGHEKAGSRKKKGTGNEMRVNRLSLLLSITAVGFFAGAVWALGRDGRIDFGDGLVLVGLFLFWQCFHVFEVLKVNVRQNRAWSWRLPLDLVLLIGGAWCLYVSTDWLVTWLSKSQGGMFTSRYLGWLSGWLMVLPNGVLAVYYARRGNPEVVYTSQIGDGHICIPLCIGIFALYRPTTLPPFFNTGLVILLGAAAVHFTFVALLGRLPRWTGAALVIGYLGFLYKGLL